MDLPLLYPNMLRIKRVEDSSNPGTKLIAIISIAKRNKITRADKKRLPFSLHLFPSFPF
jgi:hypothetical protein